MLTILNKAQASLDFVQFRVNGDSAEYIGPSSTDISVESLSLKSISPKRGNGQYGNRRSTVNLVRGTNVVDLNGDTTVRNRKLAVEASFPVGVTDAEIIDDAYILSQLLQDETFVLATFKTGLIEQ